MVGGGGGGVLLAEGQGPDTGEEVGGDTGEVAVGDSPITSTPPSALLKAVAPSSSTLLVMIAVLPLSDFALSLLKVLLVVSIPF